MHSAQLFILDEAGLDALFLRTTSHGITTLTLPDVQVPAATLAGLEDNIRHYCANQLGLDVAEVVHLRQIAGGLITKHYYLLPARSPANPSGYTGTLAWPGAHHWAKPADYLRLASAEQCIPDRDTAETICHLLAYCGKTTDWYVQAQVRPGTARVRNAQPTAD